MQTCLKLILHRQIKVFLNENVQVEISFSLAMDFLFFRHELLRPMGF